MERNCCFDSEDTNSSMSMPSMLASRSMVRKAAMSALLLRIMSSTFLSRFVLLNGSSKR